MDDTLALIAGDSASLVQAWRDGDLTTSAELCQRVVVRAGPTYPAIAAAATHWRMLTATPSVEDTVRCDAALALLVSAVRRAQTVTGT